MVTKSNSTHLESRQIEAWTLFQLYSQYSYQWECLQDHSWTICKVLKKVRAVTSILSNLKISNTIKSLFVASNETAESLSMVLVCVSIFVNEMRMLAGTIKRKFSKMYQKQNQQDPAICQLMPCLHLQLTLLEACAQQGNRWKYTHSYMVKSTLNHKITSKQASCSINDNVSPIKLRICASLLSFIK